MEKEKKFISKRILIVSGIFVFLIIFSFLFAVIQSSENEDVKVVKEENKSLSNNEELDLFTNIPMWWWIWIAGAWGIYLFTRRR